MLDGRTIKSNVNTLFSSAIIKSDYCSTVSENLLIHVCLKVSITFWLCRLNQCSNCRMWCSWLQWWGCIANILKFVVSNILSTQIYIHTQGKTKIQCSTDFLICRSKDVEMKSAVLMIFFSTYLITFTYLMKTGSSERAGMQPPALAWIP